MKNIIIFLMKKKQNKKKRILSRTMNEIPYFAIWLTSSTNQVSVLTLNVCTAIREHNSVGQDKTAPLGAL